MKFLWVLVIAGSVTAQAAEDGGVTRMFDVPEPSVMTQAQDAVRQAGTGLREVLPSSWLQSSAFGLQRWQWLAVPVLALLIGLLTWLLLKLTEAVVRRVRKDQAAAARINERLGAPLTLGWASLLTRFALPLLGFSRETDAVWQYLLRVAIVIAFFWAALRAVSAWSDNFGSSAFAQARPGSRALVSLISRVLKFALMGFAILAALAEVGYPVTGVLAGLGIGGLALALGAQKTLENVFGAFALAVDQPIREGDFVRIDDFVGTVETIGLRSTRFRTLDRTLISIPNGKLADMRLETFAARDRVRLLSVIGLQYGTTAEQVKKVIDGFHAALKAHPELWPDTVTVHLAKLGEWSLDIEVSAWFITADFDVFKRIRQEVLLDFMAAVEAAGTSIAFPTRTMHVVPAPLPDVKKPPEHEGSGGR